MDLDYKLITHKGQEQHLVKLVQGPTTAWYVTYENVLKNSKKKDMWHQFFVKIFDNDGNDLHDYFKTDDEIFRCNEMKELTAKFNPELLI